MINNKKYYTYKKHREIKKKSTSFIDLISQHWQLFSFSVVFIGYIVFSFYMSMNGFSYVVPDIGQVIGLGLFLSIILILILTVAKFDFSTNAKFFSAVLITYSILIANSSPKDIFLWISFSAMVTGEIMRLSLKARYDKSIKELLAQINSKVSSWSLLFIVIAFLFLEDKSTIFLFFMIFIFLNTFDIIEKDGTGELFRNLILIIFIIFSPLVATNYINNHGIHMLDFVKKKIEIQVKEKNIRGILIYQNDSYLYIHDSNLSLEIPKSTIEGSIVYEKYKYESDPLLTIKKIKDFYTSLKSMFIDNGINKTDGNKTN